MKHNAYFDEIARRTQEYRKAHEDLEQRFEQLMETHEWNSPEMVAWHAEEQELKDRYKVGGGIKKAYRAWKLSDGDEVIFNDYCWVKELHDFAEALRAAGIKTFVITNQSTALMANIHGFIAEGCTMLGACTVTLKYRSWIDEAGEQVQGIRFAL